MKRDTSNTWLTGAAQAEGYVSSADVIIVERQRTMKLLADIFGYHFGGETGLHVLDLGGGDGIITQYLQERHPDNVFYLLDGSADMLEKARQRLEGKKVTFIRQTFEEYLDASPADQKYDLIFSSNAIHLLDYVDKSKMYAKLFRECKFGGAFVNIDVVKAASERSERWQFAMWEDWMNERLAQIGGEAGTVYLFHRDWLNGLQPRVAVRSAAAFQGSRSRGSARRPARCAASRSRRG